MKHGFKAFEDKTQGARANSGRKQGENFVRFVLDVLNIKTLDTKKHKFIPIDKKVKHRMKPDFIAIREFDNQMILLESKYKQISGSDWEKLESNWNFHNYYYNVLCEANVEIVVILSGFWEDCQKKLYPTLISYIKTAYGNEAIFDFGRGLDEIIRFAKFMHVEINEDQLKIIERKLIEEKVKKD